MAAVTNIRAAVDVLAPGAADPRASWNCQVCGILLEVARRFCACKQKSDDPSKCAKKMGGRYEGESEQDDRHSGDPTPSEQDIQLTQLLAQGAKVLGVNLLDHIVVTGGGEYRSFVDLGLIKHG